MPKLDHVAIQVSDIEASISFYTEKLGFKLLFHRQDLSHHEAFAFLELEGGNLELLQVLDDEGEPLPFIAPKVAPPYCPHIAIQSDDLDADLLLLEKHNIPLLKGPLEISESVRWLYFCDPDNNVLEYVEWLKSDGN